MSRDPVPGFRSRLIGAMVAGALVVPLLAVAIAALGSSSAIPGPPWPGLVMRALGPTGWIGLPVLGAGLGALSAVGWAGSGARALKVLALGVVLGVVGAALVSRPPALPPGRGLSPRSARGKAQAILRGAFRSPATLAGILPFTRDPDPVVREQAVLALGVNLVVAGIEHASLERPSPFAGIPLRDSLRERLRHALSDPAEGVRAEAARALWKAPRTFGSHPAAAETLAAVLARARLPGAVERLAWLALDAAAGPPYPPLKAAAERFAAATPDSELARAARQASRP